MGGESSLEDKRILKLKFKLTIPGSRGQASSLPVRNKDVFFFLGGGGGVL